MFYQCVIIICLKQSNQIVHLNLLILNSILIFKEFFIQYILFLDIPNGMFNSSHMEIDYL